MRRDYKLAQQMLNEWYAEYMDARLCETLATTPESLESPDVRPSDPLPNDFTRCSVGTGGVPLGLPEWTFSHSDYGNYGQIRLVIGPYVLVRQLNRSMAIPTQVLMLEMLEQVMQAAIDDGDSDVAALVGADRTRLSSDSGGWGLEATFRALQEVVPEWQLPSLSLPPSDLGYPDAIPLPAPAWSPEATPLSDAEWADQNRRVNNLLMRGIAE